MPTVDVPLFEDSGMTVPNRPRHRCLHCGGAMHGGACGEEINSLIDSGEIDTKGFKNYTTTVLDDAPPVLADKAAQLFRYNNHLVCQLCWQTDVCLRVSKVADAIAETVAEVVNADEVAGESPVLKVAGESLVLKAWGKRMREGSGPDTYKSKKAQFKGD